MNFKPCTEQEIVDSKLWKKGVYQFEILDAFEKDSKAGNQMIELRVRVSDGSGAGRVLTDYLLEKTPEKLRHAAACCELLDKYDAGSLSGGDFRGKRGKLKLAVEKAKNGYPAKNVVADYLVENLASGGIRLIV